MRHLIFDIPLDDISDTDLIPLLTSWTNGMEQKMITTPNPEFVVLSRTHKEFKHILQSSDLSLPDGVGLRFAVAALTESTLKNRQTGVELVEKLVRIASKENKKIVFFGGKPDAAERAKNVFKQKYPNVQISIFNPGQLNEDASDFIDFHSLNTMQPDILLVALGQVKQEHFIKIILPKISSIKVAVGIGGSFEMIAGLKPRAPRFMRQFGLEWLWRFVIEPRRWRRIVNASIVFPFIVISATLKQHKFLRACRRVIPEIYRQFTQYE